MEPQEEIAAQAARAWRSQKGGHWGFTSQKQGPVPEAGDKLVLSQCWLDTWPILCLQGRWTTG